MSAGDAMPGERETAHSKAAPLDRASAVVQVRAHLHAALNGNPGVFCLYGTTPDLVLALLSEPEIAAFRPVLADGECAAVPYAAPLWRDVAYHWPIPPLEEEQHPIPRPSTADERVDALRTSGPDALFDTILSRLRLVSKVRPVVLLLHDLACLDDETARMISYMRAHMQAGHDHVAIFAVSADDPGTVKAQQSEQVWAQVQALPSVVVADPAATEVAKARASEAATILHDPIAEHALHITAVLGSVERETLVDLLAVTPEEIDQAVSLLQATQLLRTRANGALALPTAALRRVIFERAMTALDVDDRGGAGITPPIPADRERGEIPAVIRWLVQAAIRAQQRYTWLSAARFIDRALRHPASRLLTERERAWLLYRTALYWRYADVEYSRRFLEEVMRIARETHDDVLLLGATYHHGLIECWLGRPANGIREMEATVAAIEELSDAEYAHLNLLEHMGTRQSREHRGTLVTWLTMVGRFDDALHLGDRRLDIVAAPELEDMPSSTSGGDGYSALGELYGFLGQPDLARAYYEAARNVYTAFNHHHQVGWTCMDQLLYMVLPYATEDVELRRALAAHCDREWNLSRDTVGEDVPELALVVEYFLDGDWQRVRELCELARLRDRGETIVTPLELFLAFHAGDGEALERYTLRLLPNGVDTQPGNAIYALALIAQRLSALHAAAEGDSRGARSWLQALDRWLRWSRGVLGDAERHISWAVYYLQLGQLVPAREHAFLAYGRASDPRQPLALITARRVQAQVALGQRAWSEARRCIDEALALARSCESVPSILACQAIEVRVLRAEDKREEAAQLEEHVRTMATTMGSRRIIDSMAGSAHF